MTVSRRDLLLCGLLAPAAMWPGGTHAAPSPAARGVRRARNIIFMVADGMSAGAPSLAEPLSLLVRARGTTWYALADEPGTVRGFLETASLDSMVTDSSAASSAWGSGSRVVNGAVNVLPDGTRLTPIAVLARDSGRAVGLVTTTTITHATPAGFAAVQPSRGAEAEIALQYMDLVDVAMGGGHEFFAPERRLDGRDLYAEYRKRGYAVCTSREALAQADTRQKLLGVFGAGHLPYTIDQVNEPAKHASIPTLAEMTGTALTSLELASGGFLLQIEGGRIDHAAHSNDGAALLWDQLAFDDAIAVALAFARRVPDTLLVVTSDHGNANPALRGMGVGYSGSTRCFERVAVITASFDRIRADLGATPTVDDAVEVIRRHTKLEIDAPQAAAIVATRKGEAGLDLNGQHTGFVGTLGQVLCNYTGIAFTGTAHTSELVLTLAVGPGAERFRGIMHHTDVFRAMTDVFGIRHANASMTPAQARRCPVVGPGSGPSPMA